MRVLVGGLPHDGGTNLKRPLLRQGAFFLAQELQKVFPEAVTLGADGFYTISYSTLIPVVVQGIKEQQQQVNELKDENQQLKITVDMLVKEMEMLKKQIESIKK